MITQNLSPYALTRLELVSKNFPQVRVMLDKALTPTAWLDTWQRVQRLYWVIALGFQDNVEVMAALDDPRYKTWEDYAVLQATPAQQQKLAKLLYEGDPLARQPILLEFDDYSGGVAELVLQRCATENTAIDPWISDPLFQRCISLNMNAVQAAIHGKLAMEKRQHAARKVQAYAGSNSFPAIAEYEGLELPEEVKAAKKAVLAAERAAHNSDLFYTLTRLPTPDDAALDGIAYNDYIDLFFRMCDVDWAAVDKAHRFLIAQLDVGKTLRLTNNDGTDLTMDIEGFTFANSLVAKNIPGSEVFSAPRRDSVNGRIVAKGRFSPKDAHGDIIEDMVLDFKDGFLHKYSAKSGEDLLRQMVETDEGSHYVGEIGIGTNPVLRQHIVNSLMVEKIGGSFHVALGRAYEYTDYLGTPVRVDNGNRSAIHWDITTMLHGKQGKMILDDVEIMTDGKFNASELAVLNGATDS